MRLAGQKHPGGVPSSPRLSGPFSVREGLWRTRLVASLTVHSINRSRTLRSVVTRSSGSNQLASRDRRSGYQSTRPERHNMVQSQFSLQSRSSSHPACRRGRHLAARAQYQISRPAGHASKDFDRQDARPKSIVLYLTSRILPARGEKR